MSKHVVGYLNRTARLKPGLRIALRQLAWAKVFRPTAGGNFHKARMGCPSTPHRKERAEGPLHTAVGGSGGR
jgi:hypothetical protein